MRISRTTRAMTTTSLTSATARSSRTTFPTKGENDGSAKGATMQNPHLRIQNSPFRIRRAFTLTELLLVITIIGIMTGLGLSALAGAVELAREQRTQTIIAKIDQLIMERYESYRTRALPIRIPNGVDPRTAAR